ncbi:MAG: AbrB/MazE/SpoVT family DNA-binding domain-containing protein, partial [Candidatus Omnitrophota bacterium]
MPTTRISPKHQITIPKPVFDAVSLEVGDVLDAAVHNGKIVLTPKRLADKVPAAKFSPAEQKILVRAQAKIERIQNDLLNSKGLTVKETELAS